MTQESRRPESGMTFLELMVAATLMGLFALFLAPAGQTLHETLDDVGTRTLQYEAAQILRARFGADARRASSMACIAGDKVVLSTGAPATTLEYRLDGNRLIRWSMPPDKEFLVADGVTDFGCRSLGGDGLELDVTLSHSGTPLYVHLTVADLSASS